MQIGEDLGKQWSASSSELPVIFVSKGYVRCTGKINSHNAHKCGVGTGQALKVMV